MPFVLDETQQETIVFADYKIADFSLNLLKMESDIAYQKRDLNGNPVAERILSLDTPETMALVGRIQELNNGGMAVYDSIKAAIHEAISVDQGESGSVV